MRVPVAELKPNPYRNMKQYPIDQEKVNRLAQSIKDTTFWDNILARKNDDGYQIAYGHHRLLALRKVMRDETVDIPVRRLTDEQMLKIMANENGEEWGGQTAADLETIRAVRDYLIEHPSVTKMLPHAEHVARKRGPGSRLIAAFLGGIWTEAKVQAVLNVIVPLEKGEIDEEAVRDIPTTTEAGIFVREMRGQPVRAQRAVAKRIKENAVEVEGIAAEAQRHRVIPIAKQRERAEEFQELLGEAADQARKLTNLLSHKLWPYRDVIRKHAWQSFEGLRDLYELTRILDKFWGINEREFKALVRQTDARR